MKRADYPITAVLLLCLLLQGTSAAQDQGPPRAEPVRTAIVIRKAVRPHVTLVGDATASRRSLVAAEVGGKVVEMKARAGRAVERNQVLVGIDRSRLALDLEQARARLLEAQAEYGNAELELERTEALFEEKSISSKAYDEARFRVMALEARIGAIRNDLEGCTVRAPFGGIV